MENAIEVIFSQSDDVNVVVVSILNLSSNKDLENVIGFIHQTLNYKTTVKSPSPSSQPSIPERITKRPAKYQNLIKTQNFVNDDNLEIDVDFSDSDSEEEEEEEEAGGGGGSAPKKNHQLETPIII